MDDFRLGVCHAFMVLRRWPFDKGAATLDAVNDRGRHWLQMRELLDRIGLANAILGVVTAVLAVLILVSSPWRENFDANETLELLATFAAITLGLGVFAAIPHLVGLILDAIERRNDS